MFYPSISCKFMTNTYIMTLLLWLAVGIITGVLAKRVIPTLDKRNWVFAALIAIVGAFTGGFAGEISGAGSTYVMEVVIALLGAVTVLFFFRQYMEDAKTNTVK